MTARRGEELLDRARSALATAGEAEVEIYLRVRSRGCARFAIGELGQHMALDDVDARVRVADGTRIAEATTSSLDESELVAAIRGAGRLAKRTPETSGFEGFEGFAGGDGATADLARHAEATASMGDAERTEIAGRVLERVRGEGLVAAGMLETSHTAVAVATTRGCARAHDGTQAELRVWALDDAAGRGASGHDRHLVRDVRALEIDRVVSEAIRIARSSRNPAHVDAGVYDVVMEPPAVAELFEWLGMIAFNAPDVEEGTSPVAGRLGEKVTGEAIDITEDPLDASELGFGVPFDREGTARMRVDLVRGGIATGVLYDRVHAARHGTRSSGSAVISEFGAPGGVGPVALHLGLAGGGAEAENVGELVAGMERGLYVRRLHYVNGYLDRRRAMMTGLTRDGCFLVEGGAIGRPVGNVRLTDGFFEMLARADATTHAREAVGSAWTEGGTLVVPALRFRAVRFTSGSRRT